MYITGNSHFRKPPPPDQTQQKKHFHGTNHRNNMDFFFKNQTTWEKKTKKKPTVLSWKLMVFLGFWNTHNQWFFDYVVFKIPGTGKFFDSIFFYKYPILTILWFWFFLLIAKTDGSLKNQRTAQHWFGPMLVNSGF